MLMKLDFGGFFSCTFSLKNVNASASIIAAPKPPTISFPMSLKSVDVSCSKISNASILHDLSQYPFNAGSTRVRHLRPLFVPARAA